jgi:hypothetical protein
MEAALSSETFNTLIILHGVRSQKTLSKKHLPTPFIIG